MVLTDGEWAILLSLIGLLGERGYSPEDISASLRAGMTLEIVIGEKIYIGHLDA